jgi:outer membrane receptor protein involved in Fe transport
MSSSPKAKAVALMLAWTLAFLSILPISVVSVSAQATTGTLRGVVADTSGGIVAGASVVAKNDATGTETTPVTSSAEGTYEIAGLQPGTYTVTVEGPGFRRSVNTSVVVRLGIVNPFNIKLEPGNISETVTVTGNEAEVIQRDQSQISATFETRKIEELPSNGAGGGLDTLALLAPGIVANRGGGTNTNGTGLSVNGNRGRSNNFQIDGADNNDLSVSGPAMFVDNQDQIQEYQVVTNNFSAQYGRNQGAIVNLVTKSGTNEFHGSAFEYHQDGKHLNSLDNIEKRSGKTSPDQNIYNVFGGTVGGPVYLPRFGEGGKSVYSGKDKLFFFASYQGIRNPASATLRSASLAVLPSEFDRLRTTFPTNAAVQSLANFGAFAIPTGVVQPRTDVGVGVASMINPAASGNCPKAIAVGGSAPAGCGGYTFGPFLTGGPYDVINLGTAAAPRLFQAAQYERTVSEPFQEDNYSVKFDARPTDRDNISVRYLNQKQNFVNNLASANGFTGDIPATSKNFGGSWTRNIGNSVVNEARATYQKIGVVFGGGHTGLGAIPAPTSIGTSFASITFPTGIGLTKSNALGTIGPSTALPQGRVGKVYQVADNLTWTRGRHSFIFGGEFKHLDNVSPFLPNFNGSIGFNSLTRLLNNAPSSVGITAGNPLLTFKENDQYYFVQDDFRIRPNLTLNLGVRYEYTGQPINELYKQSLARESNPATAFYNPAIPVDQRIVPFTKPDKNNFAPRVGFAYTPHFWKSIFGEDATVIRGGFSIAYDPAFYNILSNVQNGAPFSAALNLGANLLPSTNSPFPLPGGTPTGDVIRAVAASSGILPLGKLNPRFLGQQAVSKDFHSPYSEQFSLGVQHQFGKNHVAEVRYVGNHGVGLFQNVNGNFFARPLLEGMKNWFGTGVDMPAFPQFAPPGAKAQKCVNDPATFDNEAACDGRLLPQGGLTIRANGAMSTYHSMQSRYNGRFLNNALTLGASYTWSKTIDNASEIFGFDDVISPNAQNPFCTQRCERSLSALDRPHAFSTNFIFDVPFKKTQSGFLGHVAGGWQLNGTYVLTSGAPYTPGQTFNGLFGLGNTYLTSGDRPFVGNPNVDPRKVGISQLDAAVLYGAPLTNVNGFYSLNALNSTGDAVSVTPNDVRFIFNGPGAARIFGTPFGTATRNSLRGPKLNQLNLGVFKNTRITETIKVQFRMEMFNALNHPSPGYGVSVPGTGGYLPSNDVGNAGVDGSGFAENGDIELNRRVIQFGLRIIF